MVVMVTDFRGIIEARWRILNISALALNIPEMELSNMPKKKHTAVIVSRQPALLNPSDMPEIVPLEQVALRGFIRGIVNLAKQIYTPVDVVMWAKDEDYETAQESLKYYKSLIKADETQLGESFPRLKVMGQDGKMRMTDMMTEEQINRLIIEIPGKKSGALKDMIARLAHERMQQLREAAYAALSDRDKQYVREQMRHGIEQAEAIAAIPDRIEAIDTFKAMMTEVKRLNSQANYGQYINDEYINLLGATANQLQYILNTSSIRDALPTLQLSYLTAMERSMVTLLASVHTMSNADLRRAFMNVSKRFGDMLSELCDMAGIDRITSRPVLKARN